MRERYKVGGGREEGGRQLGCPVPGRPPTWIVDPLDATTNYDPRCPLYVSHRPAGGRRAGGGRGAGAVARRAVLGRQDTGPGWGFAPALQVSQTDNLAEALRRRLPPICAARKRHSTGGAISRWRRRARCGGTCSNGQLNMAWLRRGRFDRTGAFDNHVWTWRGAPSLLVARGRRHAVQRGTARHIDPFTKPADWPFKRGAAPCCSRRCGRALISFGSACSLTLPQDLDHQRTLGLGGRRPALHYFPPRPGRLPGGRGGAAG